MPFKKKRKGEKINPRRNIQKAKKVRGSGPLKTRKRKKTAMGWYEEKKSKERKGNHLQKKKR